MRTLRSALVLAGLIVWLAVLLGERLVAEPPPPGPGPAATIPPVAIDRKTDPAWKLTLLPGIGPVRAREILRARMP